MGSDVVADEHQHLGVPASSDISEWYDICSLREGTVTTIIFGMMLDGQEYVEYHLKPYRSIPELFRAKGYIKRVRVEEKRGRYCSLLAYAAATAERRINCSLPFGVMAIYAEREL